MSEVAAPSRVSGPRLFARYAYPPNHHGYCGPEDSERFFASGVADDEAALRRMAADFDGAAPFLRLIADGTGRADPLDPDVVEAYWLGGPALARVSPVAAQQTPSGPLFPDLTAALAAGALPDHSFVVFCVYPWVAMLGDERRTPQALTVLDGCRIRWGRVLEVVGDSLTAESHPLVWTDGRLDYGPRRTETVRRAIGGRGLTPDLQPGDWVALHWDWVCDRITDDQQQVLQSHSARHLALVNTLLARRAG